MVKLFTVSEMLALEKEANTSGLPYAEMMENAGKGIAEEIVKSFPEIKNKKIFALVGSGNNGGDALVALSQLASQGWDSTAYIVKLRESDDPLINRLLNANAQIILHEQNKDLHSLTKLLQTNTICLDGVLGTGIKLPLKGDIAKVLTFVKDQLGKIQNDLHIIAVDCPSGVDCDSGEVAPETIPAEMTVTMAGMKVGMTKFPAAIVSGDVCFVSIGNIEHLNVYKRNHKLLLTSDIIKQFLPKRPIDAHKGTFGTAFIVAGSVNYTGAALLAGLAAYRIGTGLVTTAIPEILHTTLAGQFPESTWVLLPHELGVISAEAAKVVRDNIDRVTAILIGPGFGQEDTTKEFIKRLFTIKGEQKKGKIGFIQEDKQNEGNQTFNIPLVMDADALKLISTIEDWHKLIQKETILTPHPGEMSIMTGLSVNEIQNDRIEIAQRFARNWGHVVVLKGAYTVIASPEGEVAIVPIASSALARAGTGDVLSGLIVGLRAQGVSAFGAACAGAYIHALAGLLAASRLGTTASVIASDVLNAVPEIIKDLTNY